MPKVLITAAKGLHQVVGSATMLGQRSHIISLDNVATTNRTLTVDESGALVLIDPSTNSNTQVNITLPAATSGVYYTFIITADATNNGGDTVIKTTADSVNILGLIDATDGSEEIAADQSKLTFDGTNVKTHAGSRLTLVSDGSNWYVQEASVGTNKAGIATAAGGSVMLFTTTAP